MENTKKQIHFVDDNLMEQETHKQLRTILLEQGLMKDQAQRLLNGEYDYLPQDIFQMMIANIVEYGTPILSSYAFVLIVPDDNSNIGQMISREDIKRLSVPTPKIYCAYDCRGVVSMFYHAQEAFDEVMWVQLHALNKKIYRGEFDKEINADKDILFERMGKPEDCIGSVVVKSHNLLYDDNIKTLEDTDYTLHDAVWGCSEDIRREYLTKVEQYNKKVRERRNE